jgi:hypothetical protein
MAVYTCPKGHSSTEADFCSECGSRIQGVSAAAAVAPEPQTHVEKCPDCGAPRGADGGTFCEICGYNFLTRTHGEVPIVATPPSSPVAPAQGPVGWSVVISVDGSLREDGSPEPPADIGPSTIHLDRPVSLIGRRSDARGIFPEIPLNYDDGVSHRHALLQTNSDGGLILRDIGAANGTRVNGKDVEPMVDTLLEDGDEITLGRWTRISVKAIS